MGLMDINGSELMVKLQYLMVSWRLEIVIKSYDTIFFTPKSWENKKHQ